MNNSILLKTILVLIFSAGLNCLSILIAPFASPDDLGQLAFILVIFFPAAAFITGILSRSARLGWAAAGIISALSSAIVILVKYNSTGLVYALIYAGVSIAGYMLSWGLESIIKRLKH